MKIRWTEGKGVAEGTALWAVVKNGMTLLVVKRTDGVWCEVELKRVLP